MCYKVISLEKTGRNIYELRRRAGLTVRDLQDLFGFEYPQAIYNWQSGKSLPTVDNLINLASAFGCSMEEILVAEDLEDEWQPAEQRQCKITA